MIRWGLFSKYKEREKSIHSNKSNEEVKNDYVVDRKFIKNNTLLSKNKNSIYVNFIGSLCKLGI